MANYMEAKKRGFLLTEQVAPAHRNGVFQNVEEGNYEYWEKGKRVATTAFANAPTREAVGAWLDSVSSSNASEEDDE